ncbi:hypothetical protein E2C01_048956 [Portunus trituberculatus]|uniref:Uncharacterized protein n=1 Tax=Portunus trituberculatus TaxID=210409 RepID=A0A5B7GCD8_PORTR|nr:hypothetical protein [Portunus trituberculatus]
MTREALLCISEIRWPPHAVEGLGDGMEVRGTQQHSSLTTCGRVYCVQVQHIMKLDQMFAIVPHGQTLPKAHHHLALLWPPCARL